MPAIPCILRAFMQRVVDGPITAKLAAAVQNMPVIGTRTLHRFDGAKTPAMPEEMLRDGLPGYVKAMTRGKPACIEK
jgi:hypothetical protein